MSIWAWLAVCWACIIGGFVIGCWWNAPEDGKDVIDREYQKIIRSLIGQMREHGIEPK